MSVYESRRAQLLGDMRHAGVDAVIIPPSTDYLYLTGSARREAQRPAALVITRERAALLMPVFECGNEPHLANSLEIIPYADGQDVIGLLAGLLPGQGAVAVGSRLRAGILLPLLARCRALDWRDADTLLIPMRRRKSAQEIEMIAAAQRMAERALMRLVEGPVVGISELDLLHRLQQLELEEGFDVVGGGIVASGPNSALPHHACSGRTVCRGDALMFDIGGVYRGYHADFTRMFAVSSLPEGYKEIYQLVLDAHNTGVQAARIGVPAANVDAAARRVIADAGYGDCFTHRLGHGIGLDVHEAPFIIASNPLPLEHGNVFSCEPGVYLPGRFGVRIEDLLYLDDRGAHTLNTLTKDLLIL